VAKGTDAAICFWLTLILATTCFTAYVSCRSIIFLFNTGLSACVWLRLENDFGGYSKLAVLFDFATFNLIVLSGFFLFQSCCRILRGVSV
jgi:hypothetical protein